MFPTRTTSLNPGMYFFTVPKHRWISITMLDRFLFTRKQYNIIFFSNSGGKNSWWHSLLLAGIGSSHEEFYEESQLQKSGAANVNRSLLPPSSSSGFRHSTVQNIEPQQRRQQNEIGSTMSGNIATGYNGKMTGKCVKLQEHTDQGAPKYSLLPL